jgi:hypothetical protein
MVRRPEPQNASHRAGVGDVERDLGGENTVREPVGVDDPTKPVTPPSGRLRGQMSVVTDRLRTAPAPVRAALARYRTTGSVADLEVLIAAVDLVGEQWERAAIRSDDHLSLEFLRGFPAVVGVLAGAPDSGWVPVAGAPLASPTSRGDRSGRARW